MQTCYIIDVPNNKTKFERNDNMEDINIKQKLLLINTQIRINIHDIDPYLIYNSEIDDLFKYIITKLDESSEIISTIKLSDE